MIIVDLNQIMYSTMTVQAQSNQFIADEGLLRHMMLNCLRSYRQKFKHQYGTEMIIACDNRHYWRRKVFPYYKAHRKKERDSSQFDWNAVFPIMDKLKSELKEFFPYRVIDANGAEADDVIGVVIAEQSPKEKILIISGDKDFIQLQAERPMVKQYDPIRKRWLTHKNPSFFLEEHIIRGDTGDGIPNVKSDDDTFITGARQKPIRTDSMNKWIETGELKKTRNYERNKYLIDLRMIPPDVQEGILIEYENESNKSRKDILNYLIKNKLKNLIGNLNDF